MAANTDQTRRKSVNRRNSWRPWHRLPLESETAFFILVNVLDFFITYRLLWTTTHVEANPIARYFLEGWGIKGMLYFKLAMVLCVCVIAQIVATSRPNVARWLLIGLSCVVGAVVVYSLFLLRAAI